MSKRRRRQQLQLHLLHSPIRLPAWSGLPKACRDEVVALLAELLREHSKLKAETARRGGSHE